MESVESSPQGQTEKDGSVTKTVAIQRLLAADGKGGKDPFGKNHRYVEIGTKVFVVEESLDDLPPTERDLIQHKDVVDLIAKAGLGGTTEADKPKFRGGYFITDGEDLITVGPSDSIIAADAEKVDEMVNSQEPDACKIYLIDPKAMQREAQNPT